MTKIPVLYYRGYGHLETIAGAWAEGVRCVKGEGVRVRVRCGKEADHHLRFHLTPCDAVVLTVKVCKDETAQE